MRRTFISFGRYSFACLVFCLCAGWNSREWAETWGARASVEVHVVDEEGLAVSNAEVEVYFGLSFRPGATVKGKSDGRGMFAARGKTTGEVYVNVTKSGFYESAEKIELLADKMREVVHGRWLPREICTNIVIRQV